MQLDCHYLVGGFISNLSQFWKRLHNGGFFIELKTWMSFLRENPLIEASQAGSKF